MRTLNIKKNRRTAPPLIPLPKDGDHIFWLARPPLNFEASAATGQGVISGNQGVPFGERFAPQRGVNVKMFKIFQHF